MAKHQSKTKKSLETKSNCSENEFTDESEQKQENVQNKKSSGHEYTDESEQKQENVQNIKLKIEDLKRKPVVYPTLSELNAVCPDDTTNESGKRSKTKDSIPDSPRLQNETKQRRATPSTDILKKSNFNYSPESAKFKKSDDQPKSNIFIILISAFTVLFGLVCYLLFRSPPPDKPFDVASIMNNLKSDFNGQDEMTFRVIKVALSRVAEENPMAPGIIILIAPRNARNLRDSFSSQLAKSIAHSSEYISIENIHFKMPEEMKLEIDNNIKKNLTQNKISAVLVKNLDEIPFEAAMIFHSYCDHENAPFKKVVYLMTVTSDEIIEPKFGPKEWDALATKRLNSVWKNSSEDQVSSLISRLTVSVCAIVAKS